jgi:hypothetical protein
MQFRMVFAAVIMMSALSVNSANAALVSTGGGTTVLDATTGLTWVALSQTAGLSQAQIDAGAGGWIGTYQYATWAQVDTLFADAGLNNEVAYSSNPAEIANVLAFIQLFDPPRLGFTVSANGFFTSNVPADYGLINVEYTGDGQVFSAVFPPQANGYSVDSPVMGYGSLLVGVAPVPLPAAAWLLLSGIGALATLTLRRRQMLQMR